jgi:hypothetical protein
MAEVFGAEPKAMAAASGAGTLLAMTAHVSATLGKYCRIVVGDARTRAEMLEAARDAVYRWMSSKHGKVALYGRRAWNAHLLQAFLEEPTTDVDLLVLQPEEFPALRFSLTVLLQRTVPDGARLVHTYVKQHQDGRGATMTAEVGGVPTVDLSVRFARGDLCIFGAAPIPEPHCVARMIGGRTVSVLRVNVMLLMLAAESRAPTWRARRAAMQMRKVEAMMRAGWLMLDGGTAMPPPPLPAPPAPVPAGSPPPAPPAPVPAECTTVPPNAVRRREDQPTPQEQPEPGALQSHVWLDVLRRHAETATTLEELQAATRWLPCADGDAVSVACACIMECETLSAARERVLGAEE